MDEGRPDSLERGTPGASEGEESRDSAAEAFFSRLGRRLGSLWSEAGEDRSPVPSGKAAAELPPGTEVGPYRIVGRVGSGGMGTVYSARDPRLDRDVALKFLPPWLAGDPRAAERFLNEARAAAALDHPNICTIFEIGATSDGRPFIAMALYRGETLKERLELGPLPVDEAVEIAAAVVRALAAAHARGIIHRDVKPGNVMLAEDGRVKLLDFGLARLEDETHTRPGLVRGTVSYMAPEQVRGEAVGPSADLWALGVVLYEMLAGKRPFRGDGDRAVFRAILDEEPRPLDELRPDVPAPVATITRHLLRKEAGERYASASEVLADLTRDLDGALEVTERPSSSGRGLRLPAFRSKRRSVVLPVVGAVVLGLAAFVAWRLHGAGGPALDGRLVAVLPFSVRGADPSLAYLREGMTDMVAIELEGTPEARAVDNRVVLAALGRSGANNGREITPKMAVEVAREVGAGHALLGSVVSLREHITLIAHLYDASDGREEPTVSVEGSASTLPALVDQLVGRVMGVRSGQEKRLRSLTTDSLSALRFYLRGMVAYRNGGYDEAARDFAHAVRVDSSFALAAFQAWLAGKDGSARNSPAVAAFIGMAWRHRDRLGPADSEFVALIAGPTNREGRSLLQQGLNARRKLVNDQPNNPEAWYMLALLTPGAERALGKPDSVAKVDAEMALERALAVDSTFLPALWGLWNFETGRADTAAMRRYGSLYLARSSKGMSAEIVRCVETALDRDRPTVAQIMARADSVGGAVPDRCLFFYHHLPMLSAVRDSAEDFLWRQFGWDLTPLGLEGASILHDVELDGGRPREAAPMAVAFKRDFDLDTLSYLTRRIRDALWWDGDRREAAGWVDDLTDLLAAVPPDSAGIPVSDAVCVLGQWRLARGDATRTRPLIRRLRALARESHALGQRKAHYCTRVLVAWRAAQQGASDAEARIDSLAFNRGDGPSDGRLHREGYLVAASLLEQRGHAVNALVALRHAVATMPPIYMSTVLRERGRLAAEVGDTAEAIDAYHRYLALRTRPEPALAPEVEDVRQALARLQH